MKAYLTAVINGTQVAEVTAAAATKGMSYLASSYDRNLIDDVHVLPLPAN